jgi:hypothetical protein
MRLKYRRFLSCLLLATYAGISILGDGLHWLAHESGHHHGLVVVTCRDHCCAHAEHGADCHDHGSSHCSGEGCGVPSTEPVVTANDGDADSHVCGICAFLFQAVSQPAEVAATIDWQPLVVVAVSVPQLIYSPTSLGPHAPRGPPLLLG